VHSFEAFFLELPDTYKGDEALLAQLLEQKYPETVFGKYYGDDFMCVGTNSESRQCNTFPFLEFKFLRKRDDGCVQFHCVMRAMGHKRNHWVAIGKYVVNLAELETLKKNPSPATTIDREQQRLTFLQNVDVRWVGEPKKRWNGF